MMEGHRDVLLERQHEEIQGLDDKVFELAKDVSKIKGQLQIWTVVAAIAGSLFGSMVGAGLIVLGNVALG